MKKYIVSWLAVMNDFLQTNDEVPINLNGPTYNLHKYYFKELQYQKHFILHTPDNFRKVKQVEAYIRKDFPEHPIETVEMQIENAFEDLVHIQHLSETFIKKLIDQDAYVDLLLSTGTGVMKVAWFICHKNFEDRTRLMLIYPPKNNSKPKFVCVKADDIPKSVYHSLSFHDLSADDIDVPIKTPSLSKIYDYAKRIAISDHPVLIYGESGTGKELLARFIHQNSPRFQKPFLAFNCSAFTETVLESRLFGHKKGSFTDARHDHKGIFEEANNGTVFLDEIGDISPAMQIALLRVLQFNEIQPVGGKVKKVNVRVIAATNKPIFHIHQKSSFRTDLFYRFPFFIKLPSLRDYSTDELKNIINELISKLSMKYNKKIKFSDDLISFLLGYHYPGNYRELISMLDHIFIFAENIATREHLSCLYNELHSLELQKMYDTDIITLDHMISRYISKVYEKCSFNKTTAAKKLGISVNTLKKYLSMHSET